MNIARIQREFTAAQKTFAYIELHPTYDGQVYVKAALVSNGQMYTLSIRFPDDYPNEMPRVVIDVPAITNSPHRYNTGNICFLHPSMWNPGVHDLSFVLWRAAKWLNKYEVYKQTGTWPGKEVKH
jgi:ubiquitin-protein ligase